nr:hypothetical protein [uncultured Desulfuromonas sp.]
MDDACSRVAGCDGFFVEGNIAQVEKDDGKSHTAKDFYATELLHGGTYNEFFESIFFWIDGLGMLIVDLPCVFIPKSFLKENSLAAYLAACGMWILRCVTGAIVFMRLPAHRGAFK